MATGKKGGAKMASDAERLDQESGVDRKQENPYAIKVRMDRLFTDDSQKLKAIASITLGEFAVHGFKVWEKDNKTFITMPQSAHKDAEGKTVYDDLFHPITAGSRAALVGLISQEYDNALKQHQSVAVESAPTPSEEAPVQKM